MSTCPGPLQSLITGELMCRMDPAWIPCEDETWDDTCRVCRRWQERFAELRGDMKRDEGFGLPEFCNAVSREAGQ